jgi:hypothetical protein
LWFLPVYLLLIALTPVMLAAHRRWGLAVPAVMAAGAAAVDAGVVDAGVVGARLPVIGYANYLLVWGSMYQWGFAWRDGTLTRRWWRPYALAAAGAAAAVGLVAWGSVPGRHDRAAGERTGNTSPPSIALLAYLWHMVPVVIAAIVFYPAGVLPQPRIGSAEWWELRPAWEAVLAAILIPLIAGLLRLHRPLLRVLPAGLGPDLSWSPAVLVTGLAGAGFGLSRLAIAGFAPGGGSLWSALPSTPVACC